MNMSRNFRSIVSDTILSEKDFLNHISQEIWKNPELNFKEIFAHDLLTGALEKKGFKVFKNYKLDTAFRAEFSSKIPGSTICVICEFDALPGVGHACGHNLIAEAGLGAGLAIKAVMEKHTEIPGKIVVLGTPAEEGGAGKVHLINAGAFKDIDAALMVHPSPDDYLYTPFIAVHHVTVTFTGKEAHASGFPWDGLNALDAAVSCYNNLSFLRQQIKPNCKIHSVIKKGGDAANIIPGLTEMQIFFRAPTSHELFSLQERIEACIKSSAMATGCQVSLEYIDAYESLITNKVLAEIYKKYAEELGVHFEDGNMKVIPFVASSDMGNVSHVVPSIHPCFSISTKAVNHSVDFTKAAGASEAQNPTLIAAQSTALLALELLSNPEILQNARIQFEKDIKEDKFQG